MQYKIKNSLMIYDSRVRSKSNFYKFLICLFFIVLLLILPLFKSLSSYEKLLDASFPKTLSFEIASLKGSEINYILKNLFNTNIANLIELSIKDGKLDEKEKELLTLSNFKYGGKKIEYDAANFLYELINIPNYHKFFNENIELKYLNKIKFENDILNDIDIKMYKLNSDKVPIIMYHMLDYPYRWVDQNTFKTHLKKLYDSGFTTIGIEDFLNCDFSSVPPGRKPIVITFDDAFESQFRILKNGEIDSTSGVGMLEENYKLHPEFGKKVAFFIYLSKYPFGQANRPELWRKKINYLFSNGFNIGCHTYSHINLSKVASEKIIKELDAFYSEMEENFGDKYKDSMFLAYPDGDPPKDLNIIKNYNYKGYGFDACFTAWGGIASLPISSEFDKYNIPRIEANNETINKLLKEETFKKEEEFVLKLPKIYTLDNELFKTWISKSGINFNDRYLYKNIVFENTSIQNEFEAP